MEETKVKKYVTLDKLATFKAQGDLHWVVKDELDDKVAEALSKQFVEATAEEIMAITSGGE